MTPDYGLPDDLEDTGMRELVRAEARVQNADDGIARTNAVVSRLLGLVEETRSLHAENGYVPRLRAIFRGSI